MVSADRDEELDRLRQELNLNSLRATFPDAIIRLENFNLGLAEHLVSALKICFDNFDNVIVIEDDVSIPSKVLVSVNELLSVRFPPDIQAISLFPGFPSNRFLRMPNNYWRRSPYFCPWGFALQREDWQDFSLNLPSEALESLKKSKFYNSLSLDQKKVWLHRISKVISNPTFTYDTQIQFTLMIRDKACLVPLFRASENSGFADGVAVHTKLERPRWIVGHAHQDFFRPRPISSSMLQKVCVIWDSFTVGGDRKRLRK